MCALTQDAPGAKVHMHTQDVRGAKLGLLCVVQGSNYVKKNNGEKNATSYFREYQAITILGT